MKVMAVLMVLIGFAIGAGAVPEIVYSGSGSIQFWVGVFITLTAAFFGIAGVLVWLRGVRVRQVALLAALLMCSSTITATALGVMGAAPTLMGIIGSLVVVAWFWRSRNLAATS